MRLTSGKEILGEFLVFLWLNPSMLKWILVFLGKDKVSLSKVLLRKGTNILIMYTADKSVKMPLMLVYEKIN